MKKDTVPNHNTDKQQGHRRVASRMEGVVKNRSTQNAKKQLKSR